MTRFMFNGNILQLKWDKFHGIICCFSSKTCVDYSLSVTCNASHKHTSSTPPHRNDILYNDQLQLMNGVIETKQTYENIYRSNYWKGVLTKFIIAHRNECGQADTLPPQQILNWWLIFVLMKFNTLVNTTRYVQTRAKYTFTRSRAYTRTN